MRINEGYNNAVPIVNQPNAMTTEKIYYSIVIVLSAVSVLMSPFFYIKRGKTAANPANVQRQWKTVMISNILILGGLAAAWWFFLR